MGRLQTLRPRLQSVGARIGSATLAETERERGRSWARTRARILTRDRGLCTCARCARDGSVKLARDVDHRIPLWAEGSGADANLGAISASCHAEKNRAETAMRLRAHRPTDPAEWLEWIRPAPD